jgi:ferredoxin-NADP reductase
VSGYLADDLPVGGEIELRGPIGGHFVWRPGGEVPLALIAGGSGLVPLMSMLRHRRAVAATDGAHRATAALVLSARTRADVIYADELASLATDSLTRVEITLTRERPAAWTGRIGRVDAAMLADTVPAIPGAGGPDVFVCGPTGFVEAVAAQLVTAGHDADRIRTERFGPTGG